MDNEEKKRGRKPIDSQANKTDVVHVRLCHHGNLIFDLGGKKIEIIGSNCGLNGFDERRALRQGQFGKTIINAEDWEGIVAKFGGKKLFKNGFINGFKAEADAEAWVKSRKGIRHGLDQLNPDDMATDPKKD